MFAVWLLVVTGVIALVVLLTLGRGGGLPEAGTDDVEIDLPDNRPMTESDVAAVRLPVALRGYRMSHVDDLLDRVAEELATRDARIRDLEAAARGAQ